MEIFVAYYYMQDMLHRNYIVECEIIILLLLLYVLLGTKPKTAANRKIFITPLNSMQKDVCWIQANILHIKYITRDKKSAFDTAGVY